MNNYPNTELVDNIPCRYIAYGKEIGENGTPHLQGFICFYNATSKKSVIKMMPGCHIESMNGSLRQNEEYCSKDGKYIERGDKPASNDDKGRANQLRWERTRQLAQSGNIDDIDADIYIQHYSTLKKIAKDHLHKAAPLNSHCGLWIYGDSGAGKSYVVAKAYPDRYQKSLNKWWCGYSGQDVVHIDEVNPHGKWNIAESLKLWANWDSFPAEDKGGMMSIRPKKIIVTSNYSIDQMGFHENDVQAIKNRFVEVKKVREQDIIV